MSRAYELAESIVNRYLILTRYHHRFGHKLRKSLNISGRQLSALRYLSQSGPRSVSEISRFLYIRGGTTSPLLDRMERAGYVRRHRCPEDNRRVLVEPTDLGRSILAKAPMGLVARMRADLPGLPVVELESIDAALKRLSEVACGDELLAN